MPSPQSRLHRETAQHISRGVSFTLKGVFLVLAVAVISIAFVWLVVDLYVHNAREIQHGNDLSRRGQMTYASDVRVGGISGWSVSYTFLYDGKTYHGRAHIPKSYQKQMLNFGNSPFPIVFLPDDPSVNHPKDWNELGSHPWYVYGILLAIPFFLCLSRGPDLLLEFQLARTGIAVDGTVIGGKYTKSGTFMLKYEFRDSDDLLNEGSGYYPITPKKGADVVVLHLPQNAAKNRPYPFFYFRVPGLEPRGVPPSNE
jgi:hypothetical protein